MPLKKPRTFITLVFNTFSLVLVNRVDHIFTMSGLLCTMVYTGPLSCEDEWIEGQVAIKKISELDIFAQHVIMVNFSFTIAACIIPVLRNIFYFLKQVI